MKWRWLLLLPILYGAWSWWSMRPVTHPPGVLAAMEPLQTEVETRPALIHPDYAVTPVARFELEARVLAAERYRFDRGASLSPVDLALGWGPMSDTAVLDRIDVSQGGRFYFWHTANFPIARQEIETHSANMHMIPATDSIARRLKATRPGQIVKLTGYLVNVEGKDGFRWRSSLTRADTGNGACELIWVEAFEAR